MEPYTIEDIELLRQKSGISYQEAVALLDYHSGSLARALIDLEKHGKLKNEENTEDIRPGGSADAVPASDRLLSAAGRSE